MSNWTKESYWGETAKPVRTAVAVEDVLTDYDAYSDQSYAGRELAERLAKSFANLIGHLEDKGLVTPHDIKGIVRGMFSYKPEGTTKEEESDAD